MTDTTWRSNLFTLDFPDRPGNKLSLRAKTLPTAKREANQYKMPGNGSLVIHQVTGLGTTTPVAIAEFDKQDGASWKKWEAY